MLNMSPTSSYDCFCILANAAQFYNNKNSIPTETGELEKQSDNKNHHQATKIIIRQMKNQAESKQSILPQNKIINLTTKYKSANTPFCLPNNRSFAANK